jgi:uncharacterized membrane protein YhaH (DUF805 family)
MEYYTGVLKKYAVFDGRASRKEYWMFVLINFVIGIILGMVSTALSDKNNFISNIYSLAVLIPSLAVGARRLHDINKSGWWQLLCLIPIIGWIWLIVLMATPSAQTATPVPPTPPVTPPVTQ